MQTERLKVREKIAYGVGDLGNNVAYGALGFYFVFFLTDVAGLSPFWAGNIFMIVRMWNAVLDMVVGGLSDHTKTRHGRRRPYLLYGALPLGVAFALLWQVFFVGEVSMIVFYIFAGVLFSTMFSLVAIPYNALLPELSQDYNERTSISGFKMAFSFVGSLLSAMGVTLIVDTIYPGKVLYRQSYPVMGWLLGAVVTVCILLCFAGTKERVQPTLQKPAPMLKSLRSLLRLKEYRLVLGVFIFNMVGFDIIMALYIYFMKYALKISDDVSYLFMMIPLVLAVIATPLWVWVSDKLGKKKAYIISAIYFVIPLLICLFLPAGNIPLIVGIIALIGVGISASQTLTFSILPDVVEVDELKNGVRREGTIYGTTMFLYKLASAVLVALTTTMLGVFGYLESAGGEVVTQPASAILGIRLLIGIVPALCFVLSAVFVKNLPLSKQEFEAIRASLPGNKRG